MGNSPSTPLEQCLTAAAGGNFEIAFPKNNPLYQLVDVKAYNLNIPVIPAAVTRPNDAAQIAEVVKCAVASNVKVQPRSGGHSYANYGVFKTPRCW